MKEACSKYGQLMLMDSTFGLTSCSATMFSLMIIAGERISQVCCFFYSKDESLLVLHPIFEAIEELGNDFLVVESFMTGK